MCLGRVCGGGQLAAAAVGRDHLNKNVGCPETNLRHRRLCGSSLDRKRVFELMRQFAQLAQATSRGISLQRVHRASDYAHDLLVAGLLLQPKRFFVQRLQQFLRSLKEELSEFQAALIGGIRHRYSRTSTRWYAVPLSLCTIWNFLVRPSRLSAWPTNR